MYGRKRGPTGKGVGVCGNGEGGVQKKKNRRIRTGWQVATIYSGAGEGGPKKKKI